MAKIMPPMKHCQSLTASWIEKVGYSRDLCAQAVLCSSQGLDWHAQLRWTSVVSAYI